MSQNNNFGYNNNNNNVNNDFPPSAQFGIPLQDPGAQDGHDNSSGIGSSANVQYGSNASSRLPEAQPAPQPGEDTNNNNNNNSNTDAEVLKKPGPLEQQQAAMSQVYLGNFATVNTNNNNNNNNSNANEEDPSQPRTASSRVDMQAVPPLGETPSTFTFSPIHKPPVPPRVSGYGQGSSAPANFNNNNGMNNMNAAAGGFVAGSDSAMSNHGTWNDPNGSTFSANQTYYFNTQAASAMNPNGNAADDGDGVRPAAPQQWMTGLFDIHRDPLNCVEAWACGYCMDSAHYRLLFRELRGIDWPVTLGTCCADLCCLESFNIVLALPLFTLLIRRQVRARYNVEGMGCGGGGGALSGNPIRVVSIVLDVLASFFCIPCAIAQHHREMTQRGEWPGVILLTCTTSQQFADQQDTAPTVVAMN